VRLELISLELREQSQPSTLCSLVPA